MRPTKFLRVALFAAAAFAAASFLNAAAALAQAPVPDAAGLPGLVAQVFGQFAAHQWPAAVSGSLLLACFLVRLLTTKEKAAWAHGAAFTFWTSAFVAVAQAVAGAVAAGGLSGPVLASAVALGLLNAGLLSSPSAADPLHLSPAAQKAAGAAVLLVALSTSLAGCAWWQHCQTPEGRKEPGCAVVNGVVQCTKSAAETLGPVALGLVENLIGQQVAVDWQAILKDVEGRGIADAGCSLAALEQVVEGLVASKEKSAAPESSAAPARPYAASAAAAQCKDLASLRAAWARRAGVPAGTKFKFPDGSSVAFGQ